MKRLLFLLLLLLPLRAEAALTFVSSCGATGSGTTATCGAALNLSNGDTVSIGVSWEGGDTTVTVASTSNTATCNGADHTGQGAGSQLTTAICYISSATAEASATFTATLGASRTVPSIVAMQFRGGMTKGNRNIATSASGGVPSSGTIATTTANSVVVGYISNDNGAATSSETINAVAADANPQDLSKLSGFYRIVSATFPTGAASASSLGGGVQWVAAIMAFDEGGGGGGGPTCPSSVLLSGAGCR